MKACFDTSTLVAAILEGHPHHAVCFPLLRAVHDGKWEGFVTTHGVAELFSVLTAMPLKPRPTSADVQRMIQTAVTDRFSLIPLTPGDYGEAMALTVARNLTSGAIFDALHLIGARSAGCDTLYTLNLRHFQALAPGDPLVVSP